MSGIEYLADTNCFIYFLEAHPSFAVFAQDMWAYSYITEIELLSKSSLTPQQENVIRSILSACIKFDHNQRITDLTIEVRKKYKLKMPDAIIAATAMAYNVPLLTVDKEFSKIDNFNCLILDI